MLRPATPLTFLFFVAFILLLLSTLSTPIIHAIPLSKYSGYNFGVFGYCEIIDGGADACKTKLGYLTRKLRWEATLYICCTDKHNLQPS